MNNSSKNMKIRLVYSAEKKENLEFTDLKQMDSQRGVDDSDNKHADTMPKLHKNKPHVF